MQEARRHAWKHHLFGTPVPSRRRQVATCSVIAFVLVCFYGLFASFVPSPGWNAISVMIAHAVTAIGTALFWWSYAKGRFPRAAALSPARRAVGLIMLPFVLWGCSWIFLARGMPDLVTQAVGAPGERSMVLRKEVRGSRRSCARKVKGPELRAFPGHLCVSPASFHALPDHGPMRLVGTMTPMGLHVDEIEPVDVR